MFENSNIAAYVYSPSDMLAEYQKLTFFIVGDSVVTIKVRNYRNNDAKNYISAAKGGTQDSLNVKDALLSLDYNNILTRAGGPHKFVAVFTGKGTPESIIEVMKMFYDYQDKFIAHYGKSSGPRRQVADWLADKHLGWEATMQKIADVCVGLDCNGFVGNWIQNADHGLGYTPQSLPVEYFHKHQMKKRQLRATVDDIDAGDVIVWAHMGHIAAIDSIADSGAPRFNICQSAGGGPRMNEFGIRKASGNRFTLLGGGKGDVPGEVYIFSPWH
jgi:hypothetical protein